VAHFWELMARGNFCGTMWEKCNLDGEDAIWSIQKNVNLHRFPPLHGNWKGKGKIFGRLKNWNEIKICKIFAAKKRTEN
jgi:hypothetical protein